MATKEQLKEMAQEVPGIHVQANAPKDAKALAGPFYPDQSELLIDTLRGMPDRSTIVLAPDADGWLTIYRRKR